MKNLQITVAIRCITYNHEPYIRQCLEGFIIQKTNFRFVAIVHDDASTDGTADIIREYEEKYPDIIKPIYETENQYSKRDGSLGRIMREVTNATGCKYVAMCEGDDYWTDPLKLQKQVDFLEENQEYSMCFTGANVVSTTSVLHTDYYNDLQSRDYLANELLYKLVVPTASIMYRSFISTKVPSDKRFFVGDNVVILTCAANGKIRCLNEKMVVYRRNEGGVSYVVANATFFDVWTDHFFALLEYFPQFKCIIEERIIRNYASATMYYLRHHEIISVIRYFNSGMKYNALLYVKSIILVIMLFIKSKLK